MPLENRVTPFGEIVAMPERGTMFGNRGGRFHDPRTQSLLKRRFASRRWICCELCVQELSTPSVRQRLHRAVFSRRGDGPRGRTPALLRVPLCGCGQIPGGVCPRQSAGPFTPRRRDGPSPPRRTPFASTWRRRLAEPAGRRDDRAGRNGLPRARLRALRLVAGGLSRRSKRRTRANSSPDHPSGDRRGARVRLWGAPAFERAGARAGALTEGRGEPEADGHALISAISMPLRGLGCGLRGRWRWPRKAIVNWWLT